LDPPTRTFGAKACHERRRNRRRTDAGRAPEVPQTVNREGMGKLSLTAEEEKALVAFMKTLSDGPDAAR